MDKQCNMAAHNILFLKLINQTIHPPHAIKEVLVGVSIRGGERDKEIGVKRKQTKELKKKPKFQLYQG